jgi:hypothetical protein
MSRRFSIDKPESRPAPAAARRDAGCLAFSLQRTVGNRAVTSLLSGGAAMRKQAQERRLLFTSAAPANVQRAPSHVTLVDVSDLPGNDAKASAGDGATSSAGPVLPKAGWDPAVTVQDDDQQSCVSTTRSAVRGGASYVDNGLVSVGADLTDVWTMGIQALLFKTARGSDLRVPLEEIDFDRMVPADHYLTRGGVTYPLLDDGRFAFDQLNTPSLLVGAMVKLQQQEQLRGERLEYAKAVMAFQIAIANLASAVAPDHIAASFEKVAPEVSALTRARGPARAGIGADGAAGREAWFNPRGLRDNCLGWVCAVINTKAKGALVTEADIAQEVGETSRALSGKSLNLAGARAFIKNATGRSLSDTAVTLDARGLQPGTYVAFGGRSTASLEHVVIATVKADGRVVIYDPQIASKWTWFRFMAKYGPGSRAYRLLE